MLETVVEFAVLKSLNSARISFAFVKNSMTPRWPVEAHYFKSYSSVVVVDRFLVEYRTRAKETADIIAKHLPGVTYAEPDPLLNEGRPCHHIPGTRANEKSIILTDDHHRRIEDAYQKYFYRSEEFPSQTDTAVPTTRMVTSGVTTTRAAGAGVEEDDYDKHEFEIIVCHANVIRYFLCRALQLPPEAWLRYCPFNCSMTYITIRPSGNVSCRMLGDIGHLPYDASTFSKHVGFNW